MQCSEYFGCLVIIHICVVPVNSINLFVYTCYFNIEYVYMHVCYYFSYVLIIVLMFTTTAQC